MTTGYIYYTLVTLVGIDVPIFLGDYQKKTESELLVYMIQQKNHNLKWNIDFIK